MPIGRRPQTEQRRGFVLTRLARAQQVFCIASRITLRRDQQVTLPGQPPQRGSRTLASFGIVLLEHGFTQRADVGKLVLHERVPVVVEGAAEEVEEIESLLLCLGQ